MTHKGQNDRTLSLPQCLGLSIKKGYKEAESLIKQVATHSSLSA
ncbi:MAG: hypothetical protein RL124_676 [Acidobacteriota bacterium]|jgi:hypothetical protein